MCGNPAVIADPEPGFLQVSVLVIHLHAAGENRERLAGNEPPAAPPALFTCYFQVLGICPWIALTSHDHSHSCTVLLPNWHGAGQPPVDHCLQNLVQVTPQQGQNHLHKHTAANQTRYSCIVFPGLEKTLMQL